MNVVVAIDSFKGSLSSLEAGRAAAEGVLAAETQALCEVCPLADGGEGTVDSLLAAAGGERVAIEVCGPLGEPVKAEYGILASSGTAVIEMAAAAGITLIPAERRDPRLTTTRGVGELIRHAAEQRGCRRFLIGIGGSATNDGGMGMLSALGYRFLDADGNDVSHCGQGLARLCRIECEGALPLLAECEFQVACDVTNPLCGERGCSAVFAPQKGATPEVVRDMDAWLARYAELTAQVTGRDAADAAGAGAAGGLGFAFLSYLNATLCSGIELVMQAASLEQKLRAADLVITGEGRLDGQSCMGKAPVGVARLAKRYGVPVIALCGCVAEDARLCNEHGIDAFFPILPSPCTSEAAMDKQNAYRNLKNTAEQAVRLFLASRR